MKIDQKAIKALAELLDETQLSEIEITEGESAIRVSRQGNTAPVSVTAPAPQAAVAASAPAGDDATASTEADLSKHPGAVTSPMVGTVYMQSEPGADPFCKVGDTVQAGAPVMIVEAMKVMNQIKAHKSGKVTQILVDDSQPVEFGEVLLIIE